MLKNYKSNKIIVILGPTSSGKSDVAIRLAKKFNGEIISADSRQIYRGMDIGTGKIVNDFSMPKLKVKSQKSKLQLKNKKTNIYWSEDVPHYLIDIVNPTQNYNVANFKKDAEKIIQDILKRGKMPIICGGTGFWIKAVVDDVNFPAVLPNLKLRNLLRNKSAVTLFKLLKKMDSERAKNIDAKNKVRLIRAIEICKALGSVPKLPIIYKLKAKSYDFLQIGIKIDKEKLFSKIKKRLQERFDAGMIEEVKKLKISGLSWKKIQSFGLGYFWIPEFFKRNIKTREELFEKIYSAEKNYSKRQMTWFKKDKRIKWIRNYKKIEEKIKQFLKK